MADRMTLEFDAPTGMSPAEAVEQIAVEMMSGDDSGTITDGEERLDWRLDEGTPGVDIDRRQRLAAVALLTGFDLPQGAIEASLSMLRAAALCPGMTTGDMAPMGSQGRRHALEMARGLIDEMLGEIDGAPVADDEVRVLRLVRLPVGLDEELRAIAQRTDTTFEALVLRAVQAEVDRARDAA